MANDHEERQKRRELRFMSDFSTEELIQKADAAEQRIKSLQGSIERWRGVVQLRQAQAGTTNSLVSTKATDEDSEMLFLDDTKQDQKNTKADASSNTTTWATPKLPAAVPFRGSPVNPFGPSPLLDAKLRRDPQKARNQKLNELIEGYTPEDLQLWLEYTGWFNEAYKVGKLEILERKEELRQTGQAIDRKAVQLEEEKRRVDTTGARRMPLEDSVGFLLEGRTTPRNTGEPIRNEGSEISALQSSQHQRTSHTSDSTPRRSAHFYRPLSGSQSNSTRDSRFSGRSRSPSPTYARDSRRAEPDPRRGTVNRRDRERETAREPLTPPLRRNQRISPPPRTPPRRDGIVVGTSGGWGSAGGWDYGHGWSTQFHPAP